jgi:microcin C transport system permease protein
MFAAISDPVARKRFLRFRRHRRAWYSLWLLAGLYVLSLGAEVICGDTPLFVRHGGRFHLPLLRRYAEDRFLGNGVQTEPNYKRLRHDPAFVAAGGRMVFPAVPFGPHETLDPAAVPRDPTVRISLEPEPAVGNVNVDAALRVVRGQSAGWFFGTNDSAVAGRAIAEVVEVPGAIAEGVARRLRNEAAPESGATVTHRTRNRSIVLSLAAYVPRATAPDTVRLSVVEDTAGRSWSLRFDERGHELRPFPPEWAAAPESVKTTLRRLALERVGGTGDIEAYVDADGLRLRARADREDVVWPHRPVRGHWLGIDAAGRDVLARLIYGFRISVTFGLVLVVASMVLGVAIGLAQGYAGGSVDIVGQRLTEVWHAIPLLYVIMLMSAVLGRGFGLLLTCYILFNWIGISYYLRAEALRLRHQPFVDAARCLGLPAWKIVLRHILPNAMTPIVTFFPFSLVSAIGLLAALDYLGFGLPPLTPSWGELLHQAQQYRWAWWLILYPSLALFVVMMLGVFVGEGIREAYDPRPRSRLE